MGDLSRHVEFDDDAVASIIGEGLHTALRKGTEAPEARVLWEKIAQSEQAWSEALEWFVWSLDYMGITVSKEPGPVTGTDRDKECEVCGHHDEGSESEGGLGPVRYFEWPHHAHLGCGVAQGWGPR